MRKTSLIAALLVFVMLAPQVFGCPVCFGDPNDNMVKGANKGIGFLLAIVGLVQVGFIALFWTFWRRAKALERRKESFRLIDGGRAHA
ncbi:MAG TPA: hypothetical protein VF698_19050 [Thermoanaerobaculia bacterium]|jgi:hypothetical protein